MNRSLDREVPSETPALPAWATFTATTAITQGALLLHEKALGRDPVPLPPESSLFWLLTRNSEITDWQRTLVCILDNSMPLYTAGFLEYGAIQLFICSPIQHMLLINYYVPGPV